MCGGRTCLPTRTGESRPGLHAPLHGLSRNPGARRARQGSPVSQHTQPLHAHRRRTQLHPARAGRSQLSTLRPSAGCCAELACSTVRWERSGEQPCTVYERGSFPITPRAFDLGTRRAQRGGSRPRSYRPCPTRAVLIRRRGLVSTGTSPSHRKSAAGKCTATAEAGSS
jgi:hypothetical protein